MSDESLKESANRETKPYRAEYALSNRAKCKKCETTIAKDSLKLAYMVKSRFHDGYDAKNCHLKCFFEIKRPKSIAEIGNYEKLKYEDQQLLEKALETNATSVLGIEKHVPSIEDKKKAKAKAKDKGKKRDQPAADGTNYGDFCIELAKSNRSTCLSCKDKIKKDTVRFGKLDFEVDMNAVYAANGPLFRWHHLDCFAKNCSELEFYGDVSSIKGFEDLSNEDKDNIKKTVIPVPKEQVVSEDVLLKKMKKSDEDIMKEKEEEKILKRQSDRYYKLKEFIGSMKRGHISEMLEYMNQKYDFKNGSTLIDMATDIMLFGPLEPCPKCQGKLLLKSSAYICTGGSPEYPCNYETRDPNRGAPDVPKHICEEYDYLRESYIFKPRKRIFPSKFINAIQKKEEDKTVSADAPLKGLIIGISSWKYIVQERDKVESKVINLGAKLKSIIDKNLFFLITSEEELVKKGNPRLEVAEALGVPFVRVKCIFDIKDSKDVISAIKKNMIGECNEDLAERYERFKSNVDTDSSQEQIKYEQSR